MTSESGNAARIEKTVGLLLSGGLDSAILLRFLLDSRCRVQPFYVDFGLYWQTDELRALNRYLSEVAEPRLPTLVTLELPLADVYDQHWSVTGENVPDRSSPNSAVSLPFHNACLILKAALWCQLHGVEELALAILQTSPFGDAKSRFFEQFEAALNLSFPSPLRITCPFSQFDKQQVMALGRGLPLELTFSCLAPAHGRHCGTCNKCEERQQAFRSVGYEDRTEYAHEPIAASESRH